MLMDGDILKRVIEQILVWSLGAELLLAGSGHDHARLVTAVSGFPKTPTGSGAAYNIDHILKGQIGDDAYFIARHLDDWSNSTSSTDMSAPYTGSSLKKQLQSDFFNTAMIFLVFSFNCICFLFHGTLSQVFKGLILPIRNSSFERYFPPFLFKWSLYCQIWQTMQ